MSKAGYGALGTEYGRNKDGSRDEARQQLKSLPKEPPFAPSFWGDAEAREGIELEC
ncbi:hypothetical protein MGG_17419 [Pyricularia oryzae 70-15]|uniref:Uncharacterized protein n=3 Tax=Pyricularia oryzae TaxID=318829 RepID=G4NBA8_PYRO7|nr:uncharacterized protein MGG_17419 [Pyricularia oryzae 70-15]EHA48870.1 hypothetical protein MGG_17419 [Pyricularia oryzae 70-15]ELQ38770.1 hypothetical protein OOU_Y34scaffold00528g62 [Pyricularia oryzae Y34]